MNPHDAPDHTDIWLQTAAAVDYLAATTRPGLTVWDAVADALQAWRAALVDADHNPPTSEVSWTDPDPLRTTLVDLFAATPPAGSPGGHPLGDLLSAALAVWVRKAAQEVNDGYRFAPVVGPS